MPCLTNSPSWFSLAPSDVEESFGLMLGHPQPSLWVAWACLHWLPLQILFVCPAGLYMRDGRLTPLLDAVFIMSEQEQLGWSPSWAGSRDPAQPPVPVQHQIHSKWAFPTSPLTFLIQEQLYPVSAVLSGEGFECWHSVSKDNQVHLLCIVLNFSVKITGLYRMTEYPRLDGIHKDHWVTIPLSECPVRGPVTLVSLAPCSDQVKNGTATQPLSTDFRGL